MFFTLRFRLISMNKLLSHVQFSTRLFKKYNIALPIGKILYKLIYYHYFLSIVDILKEVKHDFNSSRSVISINKKK